MYISQGAFDGYYCCKVVAFLNAARFHGKKTISSGSPAWQELVEYAGCKQKDTDPWHALATRLSINPLEIPLALEEVRCNLPVMIALETPYNVDHFALIVGVEEDTVQIANYKGHLSEEVVSLRKWDDLRMVGSTCYSLQLL